jgi:dTMP kinase
MRHPQFITFEGIDGVGKTTQVQLLTDYLIRNGKDAVVCYEPGATEIGEQIRAILLNPDNVQMFSLTELLLFFASRSQLIQELIIPSLRDGKVVLADRFFDSTLAYQGYGRGIDIQLIERLNAIATQGVTPDITFLLDIDVADAIKRSSHRNHQLMQHSDRMEKESFAFLTKVRQGFLQLASAQPERIKIIDASGSVESTHRKILSFLHRLWL